MASVEYADLSEEQKEAQILALMATFHGLPGVTGAPLVMGADSYYREVAIHQLEAGVRVIATPIKTYSPPDTLRSAGKWVYNDPDTAPESHQDRYKRLAREENAKYMAEVARRKAEKPKPKRARRK